MASHSEGVPRSALGHVQDVPEISQSPLSDRTQKVEHWGCGCVPIVLASGDMQAWAVEAVDTAHRVPMAETVGCRPRCSTMSQTSSGLLPCDEGHRLRLSHHTGVLLPNTRKNARSAWQ